MNMQQLKVLWVEDDLNFGDSIHLRIKREVTRLGFELSVIEKLTNGNHVSDTVRDLQPDIIMMDHNLDNVLINGANLIIQIRFQNHDTPIVYYSSEMDQRLIELVRNENKVFPSSRDNVADELLKLLQNFNLNP